MNRPRTAVLIVDASPIHGDLVAELKAAGLVTAQASKPEEAKEYLKAVRFDVVVVDLDTDALAARRFLAEVAHAQPDARRIAATADGLSAPGLPLLRKPLGLQALLDCLR